MWTRLYQSFKKAPLVWNSVLYSGLYSAGNLTQQSLEKKTHYNLTSVFHMALMGCFCFSPFNFFWYKILDKSLVGASRSVVIKKLLCDQGIATPIGISLFYIGTSVLERKEDKLKDFKEKGLKTFLIGCVFWPTVQTFNFALLPNHLRVSYVGCAAFAWTNILCFMKYRYKQGDEVEQQSENAVDRSTQI